jgi:hypothetical protein
MIMPNTIEKAEIEDVYESKTIPHVFGRRLSSPSRSEETSFNEKELQAFEDLVRERNEFDLKEKNHFNTVDAQKIT